MPDEDAPYTNRDSQKEVQFDIRSFRAPGRVNLIGEHTDYNDGFVMPAAINFYTYVDLQPLAERKLEIYSEAFGEYVEADLDRLPATPSGHWSDYAIGVAVILKQAGHELRGARLRIRSDVPLGAGLSSSAAVEVATALALAANSNLEIDRREFAKLCQKAENEFVGARVGIMDQFVSLHGVAGHSLLLDCRSLDFRSLPIPEDVRLVICNTMVKHSLAASAYNERREQCEAAIKKLGSFVSGVYALRDVSLAQLEQYRHELSDVIYRRCRHVISENERVLSAVVALEKGDPSSFGRLMNQSHESLRVDYEVSCSELDLMVELARSCEGVYGARMTGGGFGGCTVNLVEAKSVREFSINMQSRYQHETSLTPEIYVCAPANGAEETAPRGSIG